MSVLTTFAGADYSAAAKQPNPTWLALGRAGADDMGKISAPDSHILSIYKLEKVGSDRLGAELLAALRGAGGRLVSGLDFPFGFPVEFLNWLELRGSTDIGSSFDPIDSQVLDFEHFADLEALVQEFVRGFGREPKTLAGRLISPMAASPLHRINPGLLKMTWQGRGLLRFLRRHDCAIPPFDGRLEDLLATERHVVMEVYPTAMLYSAGLPFRKYKGDKPEAGHVRRVIIDKLSRAFAVKPHKVPAGSAVKPTKVVMEPGIAEIAACSDDALDAVLACYSAFIASLFPFACNPDIQAADRDVVAREGWIYTPYGFRV